MKISSDQAKFESKSKSLKVVAGEDYRELRVGWFNRTSQLYMYSKDKDADGHFFFPLKDTKPSLKIDGSTIILKVGSEYFDVAIEYTDTEKMKADFEDLKTRIQSLWNDFEEAKKNDGKKIKEKKEEGLGKIDLSGIEGKIKLAPTPKKKDTKKAVSTEGKTTEQLVQDLLSLVDGRRVAFVNKFGKLSFNYAFLDVIEGLRNSL